MMTQKCILVYLEENDAPGPPTALVCRPRSNDASALSHLNSSSGCLLPHTHLRVRQQAGLAVGAVRAGGTVCPFRGWGKTLGQPSDLSAWQWRERAFTGAHFRTCAGTFVIQILANMVTRCLWGSGLGVGRKLISSVVYSLKFLTFSFFGKQNAIIKVHLFKQRLWYYP